MNPIRYLDCRFQELTKESHELPFSIFRGAHMTALTWLLQIYSVIMGILFIPKVFLDYALTILHLKKSPLPELELMKASQDQDKAAVQRKLARKIGMSSNGRKVGLGNV